MKPTSAKLTSGLPTEHPVLDPKLLKEDNVTAATPTVSNQHTEPVCASHSLAKAIMALLDKYGWDAKQEEVIKALVEQLQSNGQAKNPDEFTGKSLIVKVSSKSNPKV